jgi:hypothetical protein
VIRNIRSSVTAKGKARCHWNRWTLRSQLSAKTSVGLVSSALSFAKYRGQYDPAVVHVKAPLPAGRSSAPSGYTSAMEQMLSDKFGIQIIFHGKDGKPPYGYTVHRPFEENCLQGQRPHAVDRIYRTIGEHPRNIGQSRD